MEEFCGTCEHLKTNETCYWGDEYYCEVKGKTFKKNAKACSSHIPKKDKGYQRSGCYITTMVCKLLDLPDDCIVLTSLRSLREDYLKTFDEGIKLLQEYDQIGPMISQMIEIESIEYIKVLYFKFLVPCKQFIEKGLYPQAALIYESMFRELEGRYNLLTRPVNYELNTPIEILGKARIRKM